MTALAQPKYRLIDPHVHVWKQDPAYPWAKETARPPEKDATPETLIDLMRANGVEKTVVVQYIGYRWDNRYTLDTLKKYPQYFRGVARVNPQSPAAPDDCAALTAPSRAATFAATSCAGWAKAVTGRRRKSKQTRFLDSCLIVGLCAPGSFPIVSRAVSHTKCNVSMGAIKISDAPRQPGWKNCKNPENSRYPCPESGVY